ncbi:hypothetical protein D3C80_1719360 [compost metagenome]
MTPHMLFGIEEPDFDPCLIDTANGNIARSGKQVVSDVTRSRDIALAGSAVEDKPVIRVRGAGQREQNGSARQGVTHASKHHRLPVGSCCDWEFSA